MEYELNDGPDLLIAALDSNYISSTSNLNYSSKSNTTNTSSSSNSLAFNEDDDEDDEFEQNKSALSDFKRISHHEENYSDSLNNMGTPTTSSSANSINNHISNNSQLITSLTSSLLRTNPSSSSSSTTSSSNECSNISDCPTSFETNKSIFLLNAFVNGFAQLKLCADKIDFEYIIEVYWSNETRSFVKRTFDDFTTFHRELIQVFSQFFDEIKMNVNKSKAVKSNSLKRNGMEEYLMPVLPSSRKPFWVSHLKLAESRETELNTYVQRLLKLPTKIAHSELVLKFFESQSSDPKPARLEKLNSSPTSEITNSNDAESELNYRTQEISNLDFEDENGSNQDNNSHFEYEDEIDDDYDADSVDQYMNRLNGCHNNYNNLPISNSMIGLNHRRSANREAGLWWDEDEALNELTSSMSFDFIGHAQNNKYNQINFDNQVNNDDGTDDLETLKTLEKILKNSDLFRGDTKTDSNSITSVSTSTMLKMSENQMINNNKRLSLS